MSSASLRIGVGSRLLWDGELVHVIEMHSGAPRNDVVVRAARTGEVFTIGIRAVLAGNRGRVLPDSPDPSTEDFDEPAPVVLSALSDRERQLVSERASHIREVITGFRSGFKEFAEPDEPRQAFDPCLPLTARYEAKADELGVTARTIQQWMADYRRHGVAGLAIRLASRRKSMGLIDDRWTQTAAEVMVEYTDLSRPSRSMVITRTNARVVARFGVDVVKLPSRATAFRALEELEKRHPTFRLSTKRNRDIGGRPGGVYGRLRPSRPGEYLLMDTTRLDVFALDPLTLRWIQAELTVGMDWYTRCITGVRVTPVSTKSVDAAAVLYQSYEPPAAGKDWPAHAAWPAHGIPRSVLVDVDTVERGTVSGRAGPAIVPETIVVDHGKIYISEHLTSTCERMGISIQPVRLRTGRDKGPVERFFRTIREDLLQMLPGYKGPDVHSRGLDPESDAFFYLDELEAIIREWVAVVYHHRPHGGLVDPGLPGLELSPRTMFEHGVARAGYLEIPRDPDLAYEFLDVEWRTIQHYGVEYCGRRYNGSGLNPYRNMTSPFTGKAKGRWPFHHTPDDITRMYFRDPDAGTWHTLLWEHAPAIDAPMSEDALQFARKLAASKYRYPDDRLAVADLMQRWKLGLGSTIAERRIALRLARETESAGTASAIEEPPVSSLPSVARVLSTPSEQAPPKEAGADDLTEEGGDDDEFDSLAPDSDDSGDYYAEAFEDV
ncbi:integrase family protein [Mycobacteroides abscessus]|uniref:Transposase n=1 Tax=Mycobacteroides abscessus TaxID=36809 RepID=A0ABD7HKH7_9MYCO|nr:DDE-type integrase/transposase/recombinase [Mycobacteroides abscessus]PVA36788.1 transposase [Mycobacteroides abscessus]PVA44250.1 transposase [Mycobacteroides abscessus]PVB16751.1 transposase [Mycobacteroides abscessus]RIQ85615.1 transposase [Mycobacteroides abscessus]RIQ93304.1 transposase [Mycobacteroides abscessus]